MLICACVRACVCVCVCARTQGEFSVVSCHCHGAASYHTHITVVSPSEEQACVWQKLTNMSCERLTATFKVQAFNTSLDLIHLTGSVFACLLTHI